MCFIICIVTLLVTLFLYWLDIPNPHLLSQVAMGAIVSLIFLVAFASVRQHAPLK